MRSLFLDTSAYSLFKRGDQRVLEEIRTADRVCLNAIVIGELLSGFDRGRYRIENRKELRGFLNHPAVVVFPLTEETAERYSFIHNDLLGLGRPIPTNDLWIAASVMETGSLLLTADGHFSQVRQIQAMLVA